MSRCDCCGHDPKLINWDRSWAFVLPLEPPSQNQVSGNRASQRHKYKKLRDQFELLLRVESRKLKIPRMAEFNDRGHPHRRWVRMTRLFKNRVYLRDKVNNAGGMKLLLDALVNEKLLVNDTEHLVEDVYAQEYGKIVGVRIEIAEFR